MNEGVRRRVLAWAGAVLAGAGAYLTLLAYLKPGTVFALVLLASFCE